MIDWHLIQFKTFLLIFFRVAGMFTVAPFFGAAVVPNTHKILLSIVLALVLFPVLTVEPLPLPDNPGAYFVAILAEMVVGMLMGLAMLLLFIAFQFGGSTMGREMGFALANVVDPLSQEQVSIIGQLTFLFSIMIYLAIDGHHVMFSAMVQSFDTIPLGGLSWSNDIGELVAIQLVLRMFVIAVKLAAPVAVAVFFTTIAMGFLSKAVPEMNLFIMGFSLRIYLGLMGLVVLIPLMAVAFDRWFGAWIRSLDELIQLMGGG